MTLDAVFGPAAGAAQVAPGRRRLGMVIGGSLSDGLDLKLDPDVSVEEVKAGQYVTVDGERSRFFCVVSDLRLGTTDPALAANPPDLSNPIIAQALRGTGAYGVVHVVPTLIQGTEKIGPVRTVPPHYAAAYEATQEEIERIFGPEDASHLWIGSPLDMENTFIRLDLSRLTERSTGVFGKSGTGKTFLTRILMAGILQKGAAVQLIFDMHNEYGWMGTSEGASGQVKGLKQLFGSRVAVFTLDEAESNKRLVETDATVEIGLDEITPEDLHDAAEALGLNDTQTQAIDRLERRGGRGWLSEFLGLEGRGALSALKESTDEHEATLSALHRRLQSLKRLTFIKPKAKIDSVRQLLDYLQSGKTVVLEFGHYRNNSLAHVLVANMLSRRIYARWADAVDTALAEKSKPPPQLVITLEEAHKFLNPGMAGQTIFGVIAREMRKYNVTLLVVDQRPSAIDSEVLSQIGTKITCLLEDEKDVSAVLAGTSGSSGLRGVLARLESKQQALIFGHAVPMPVVVRTRDYGTAESYTSFGFRDAAALAHQAERDARDLMGE